MSVAGDGLTEPHYNFHKVKMQIKSLHLRQNHPLWVVFVFGIEGFEHRNATAVGVAGLRMNDSQLFAVFLILYKKNE